MEILNFGKKIYREIQIGTPRPLYQRRI